MTAGVAFGETGVARAGMGVDAADYDGTGRPSLMIGNFSNEMMGLYHNEGNGLFVDEAPTSGVGQASLLTLTFAAFFFDYDLDGRLDIFAGNGHVADDISAVQPKVKLRPAAARLPQPRGSPVRGGGVEAGPRPAAAHRRPRRGLCATIDNDGDLDVLVTTNNGPAHPLPQRRRQPEPRSSGSARWARNRTATASAQGSP